MKILHTITCTRYNEARGCHIEQTRSLTRSSRLTHKGAERILAKDDVNPESGERFPHPLRVCRIEFSTYIS